MRGSREQMKDRVKRAQARRRIITVTLCALVFFTTLSFAQQTDSTGRASHSTPAYPKEIRGYKVELAKVEIKKQDGKDAAKSSASDSLIQLGDPRVVSLSPLGVTLEVPVTVAAVKQGGRVDFLTFEEMVVNGTPVTVNEYQHPFDLPNDHPVTLPDPVTIYISTPRAVLGVLGEWNKPKDVWPVTGRVYVFGQFKKFLFKFKRVVPVELDLAFKNPLNSK